MDTSISVRPPTGQWGLAGRLPFGDTDLDRIQKQLWQLIREEARAADAELLSV